MTLMAIVYYFQADLFLVDPSVREIEAMPAIIVSLVAILGSWFVYDLLCRSPLRAAPRLLAVTVIAYLALLAWFVAEVFSGRAAYIHVGAAIGTMMVGNVFFVIIPAQKALVGAISRGEPVDPAIGKNGLLRSTHNNYLTLPVLFIMISSHFPSTYGHPLNWLVLVAVSLIGVAVRHYFNRRHVMRSLWWILPVAFLALAGVAWLTAPAAPGPGSGGDRAALEKRAMEIVEVRCTTCHANSPTFSGFSAPPAGLVLENPRQVEQHALRIYQAAVQTRTMPVGNLTAMTEEERQALADWYFDLDQGTREQDTHEQDTQ